MSQSPILITGGAGFIASHFVRRWLSDQAGPVVNLDALTYAGSVARLAGTADDLQYRFVHGNIIDRALDAALLAEHRPRAIVHMAAESHVDRSIDAPAAFVKTNIIGTQVLLDAALEYWRVLPQEERAAFRFLYASTDEVFGSAAPGERHNEASPFRPSSPYAASKAAADHLVQAYYRTYRLPVVTLHPSNTYGPWQLPEKVIPLLICRAAAGAPMPIYGDGRQVRDWMHVDDCCRAFGAVLERGNPGESYVAGGGGIEQTNRHMAETICDLIDELHPRPVGGPRRELIQHVADRPGHDRRYALDCTKIQRELNWQPQVALKDGLRATVLWHLENSSWVDEIRRGSDVDQRHGLGQEGSAAD